MLKNLLTLIVVLSIFTACSKDKSRVVDTELTVYVDRFFEAAASRELELEADNLEVVFADLRAEGVCGLGYFRYKGTDLRKVEINRDFFCWEFHDEFARESLVFHELGHAILKKTHTNTVLPNGLPSNIMCDGNVCDVFGYYGKYTLGKRAYYLNKLFKPGTPTPDWGKVRRMELLLLEEDLEGTSVLGAFDTSNLNSNENFTYEITQNPQTGSQSIELVSKSKLGNNVSGNWVIRNDELQLEEGITLQLSATINTENLEGEGATLVFRVYSSDGEEPEISAAASIRNSTTIIGNMAPKKYSTIIPYYPSNVAYIEMIFRLLPNTSGTVYFDDIQLAKME